MWFSAKPVSSQKAHSQPATRDLGNRNQERRHRQEGNSCSSRITKNTGTAQGDSNRTDVFAQVRFPNSNHCRNRDCSLKVVPLCPSCGSCDNMDAGSSQPGTSIVVEPRLLPWERMVKALQRLAKGAHHFQHPPDTGHHGHNATNAGVVSVAPVGGGARPSQMSRFASYL